MTPGQFRNGHTDFGNLVSRFLHTIFCDEFVIRGILIAWDYNASRAKNSGTFSNILIPVCDSVNGIDPYIIDNAEGLDRLTVCFMADYISVSFWYIGKHGKIEPCTSTGTRLMCP